MHIPQLLCITGQSGSGKGTIIKILKEIYNEKGLESLFVSSGDLIRKYKSTENLYIVLDGAPRLRWQFSKSIFPFYVSGYFSSVGVIEVIADEKECISRLVERTRIDKRLDLSMDGSPGIPDHEKIKTKISWYSKARNSILAEIKKTKSPLVMFDNNCEKWETEEKLRKLFK